jgi:GNAT superfamily N-acetyltransferase
MPDPKSYVVRDVLRDSTPVTLRAARADDGPRIRRAFANLTRETVYSRFFLFKADINDAELQRIIQADFGRNVALLVIVGSGDEEVVIGGASYAALDAGAPWRSAEVAFTVEEDYQGLGVASLLMRHIVRIATEAGLVRLEADVLATNAAMLAVFRRSGLRMTTRADGGVVHVALSLEQTSA